MTLGYARSLMKTISRRGRGLLRVRQRGVSIDESESGIKNCEMIRARRCPFQANENQRSFFAKIAENRVSLKVATGNERISGLNDRGRFAMAGTGNEDLIKTADGTSRRSYDERSEM